MIEEWKQIKDTNYFVSNQSRVKSVKNGRDKILKPFKSNHINSYFQVALSIKGKVRKEYLHRLVAIAFVPNPNNKSEVNHKNGVKTDNKLENLEWVSHRDNMKHAKRTGLSPTKTYTKLLEEDIPRIRSLYATKRYYQKELAQMFGVSAGTINGVVNHNHWK